MTVFRVHLRHRDGAPMPPVLVNAGNPDEAAKIATRRTAGAVTKIKRDRTDSPRDRRHGQTT